MTSGWQRKKLADVLKIQNGYAFDSKKFNSSKGMPLVRIRSLKLGIETETWFDGPYDEKYVVKAGDLLIGMDGEFGCFEWKGSPSLLNQRVCRLQDFTDALIPKFLFYGVNDHLKAIEDVTGFTTVKHLSSKQVLNIDFPVPPLPEQQRIVAILDEAFDGIATARANAEQNLQNARAIFESHLQAVFSQKGEGWVEKRLQDVCEKITDGTHQTPKYFEDGVIFLSSRNVTRGTIDWENVKYIDARQHLEMHKRVAPRVGDILLAKNGTTGVAAIVDRDVVFDIYVSLALLRSLGEVRRKYLLYFVNSPIAKKQFNKRLKGVGVPNLHLQEIREVRLRFPVEIHEQDVIIEHLDSLKSEVERLESLYQRKIDALDELKKSLLNQAFSGNL